MYLLKHERGSGRLGILPSSFLLRSNGGSSSTISPILRTVFTGGSVGPVLGPGTPVIKVSLPSPLNPVQPATPVYVPPTYTSPLAPTYGPVYGNQGNPVTVSLPPSTPGGVPPPIQANAGTPVPAGYPTNQFYVNGDGSVWEYNAANGQWFNTGKPYSQVAQTGLTNPPSTAGTPVPTGYPTNQTFIDASGNQWVYNATANAWQFGGAASGGSSALPTAAAAPASTSPVSVTTDSGYQSVLDWLSESTLISPVPNFVVALGAALLLYKASQPAGRQRNPARRRRR